MIGNLGRGKAPLGIELESKACTQGYCVLYKMQQHYPQNYVRQRDNCHLGKLSETFAKAG